MQMRQPTHPITGLVTLGVMGGAKASKAVASRMADRTRAFQARKLHRGLQYIENPVYVSGLCGDDVPVALAFQVSTTD